MSIFNNDIISKDYRVSDFYNIRILNGAWGSLNENIYYIFGKRAFNFADGRNYIYDIFNKMDVMEFRGWLMSFIEQSELIWNRQKKLHRFLRKKFKVCRHCLQYSYFETSCWGGKYIIFIPNGYDIEGATADGITILIDEK